MSEEYQLSFNDYLLIVKRRWLHFTIPFVIALAISALVTMLLPPVYQSTGVILIETQQIPKEIVQSTITGYVNERIRVISQRIMTRTNLLELIDKHQLFEDQKDKLTVSEQIGLVRENIDISPAQSSFGVQRKKGRGNDVIAFNISYADKKPSITHAMTNDLVTLFLNENVKTRTKAAIDTTEFLGDEVQKLKEKLEQTEKQIAIFKQANSEALPENLEINTNILQRTEEQLKNLKRESEQARQEIRFYEIELSAAKKKPVSLNPNAPLTPGQELANLESEYSELMSIYTEEHPDVRAIKRKMKTLQKQIKSNGSNSVEEIAENDGIDVARIFSRIEALNKKIISFDEESKELEQKRLKLEKVILKTPQVKNALISLTRDYENTLLKYKDIQAKEMEASLAESLEQEKKAERFTLIESPQMPEKPIKPNRPMVFAIGAFISFILAAGIVFILELSNQRVWGATALTAVLKQRPLVSIGYIETVEEMKRKKSLARKLIIIFLIAILGLLAGVHFLYMPLDIMMYKILARLG